MKVVGIFGGTFNPPHLGHYRAAKAFRDEICTEKLIIMPGRIPPHKKLPKGSPNHEQRLELCRLAFSDIGEVSDFEIKNDTVSYTYYTVKHIESVYPDSKIALYMGDDMLFCFESWYNAEYLLTHTILGVANRSGRPEEEMRSEKERLENKYGATIKLLGFKPEIMSSTEIRNALKNNKDINRYLAPNVEGYIRANGLYFVR